MLFKLLSASSKIDGIYAFMQPFIDFLVAWGHLGLALYTLLEVLLIIPAIETVLYPLIASNPSDWLLYIVNVIIFNLIGSAIGYFLGRKYGYPILEKYTNTETVDKVKKLFDQYGVIAVGLGAFTPVPYTIVVIMAGISRMDFKKYMISGFIGRLPRYLIGGYIVMKFTEQSDMLQKWMTVIMIVGGFLFIGYTIFAYLVKKFSKKEV